MSEKEKVLASIEILSRIIALSVWENAQVVLAFLPMKDEVDTIPLIEAALAAGKKTAVPRIDEFGDMVFHYIGSLSAGGLKQHNYGMLEPLSSAPVSDIASLAEKNVLMLIPGLAFDSSCRRLGRGKSFYDRFLTSCMRLRSGHIRAISGSGSFIKAGIAFDIQITETVPVQEHDITLDYVITEKSVYSSHT
jgi:5-formyltetrahydrofolate cyclo-ligase